MPVLGDSGWAMACGLNLASCRMRAEALARQLHSNLWVPRSPGDSGTVSPSFGFPNYVLGVVDRPPASAARLDRALTMAGLGCGETAERRNGGVFSPPDSPLEKEEGRMTRVLDRGKDPNHHAWRPDSPPESFTSESDLQSDSPALTIETEEPSSTTSNSVETVSELASPTDYGEVDSPLTDELLSRLRLIQSSQAEGAATACVGSNSPEDSTISVSSTLSSVSASRDALLSPQDPCPRLVRSTSLKTGKTPPGTPSHKKIVRFADVLGLDLEAIRHFRKDDDFPVVPQSAFADLKLPASASAPQFPWAASTPAGSAPGLSGASCSFVPQFTPPGTDPRFLDRVRLHKVCLEDLVASDLRLSGIARVLNLGFEKQVRVRYTTSEWAAHTDLDADYVPKSCDGFSDKFAFSLELPHLCPGQRLLFALRYVANGQEFWDNNNGVNYVLKCQAKPPGQDPSPAAVQASGPRWLHHFM